MANFLTYANIQSAIESISKQFTAKKSGMIEYLINEIYLSEVIPGARGLWPLFWLVRPAPIILPPSDIDISNISQSDPCVITTDGSHHLEVGDVFAIWGVEGMTEINGFVGIAGDGTTGSTIYVVDGIGNAADDFSTLSGYSAYTSGGAVYLHGKTLPSSLNVDEVLSVSTDGGSSMVPLNNTKWAHEVSKAGSAPTGTYPKYFRQMRAYTDAGVASDLLLWYPYLTSSSGMLKYTYTEDPQRLENDADVPLLPPKFHDIIISGAVARLAEGSGKAGVENPAIWADIYTAQLKALQVYNEKYWIDIDNRLSPDGYNS